MKRADVETIKHCGKPAIFRLESPGSIHYGRAVCQSCGRWIDWVSKPRGFYDTPDQTTPEEIQVSLFGDEE